MAKRSFILVTLLLSLAAGALVTAPPAAASIRSCGSAVSTVNNSHGQLVVSACIRHTAGAYYSYGYYWCYEPASVQVAPCNIGATQRLWYNATLMRSDNVSGIGLDGGGEERFEISGSPAGCTTALIHTEISNIRVRFSDGTLWNSSKIPTSAALYGSQSC